MQLKILVGYDFSPMADGALAFANDLATATGGTLHVHHTVLLPSPSTEAVVAYPDARDIRDLREQIVNMLALRRITASVTVSVGVNAGEGVCQTAREAKATLIVVGTRGRGGLRRAMLGSVADYVVRHADCPVTTIRQGTAFSAAISEMNRSTVTRG